MDNSVLDQYKIPFGEWIDQSVDWIAVNMEPTLDAIKWPFDTANELLVERILSATPWLFVVVFFFALGTLMRNVRVGVFAAAGLTVCGLLGPEYWLETMRTIGFIAVAMIFCVVIGIPAGIACGKHDVVWQTLRPVLDAMQVVHSFVYMLPFIYFFDIGEVSATMVTMVFALPPLIRLTNLGIREVPNDIVEASRAYGAPEWRVLFDVQLPLAKQAILTGVNQTLLLSISMLGIAAIMGAGGLGRLLFNALNRQSVSLGASSGLAFFLVAVILDRIFQPDAASTPGGVKQSFFSRVKAAWTHLKHPANLLPENHTDKAPLAVSVDTSADATQRAVHTPHTIPLSMHERKWIYATCVGGLIVAASTLATWTSNTGFISAYGRRADESLPGKTFNGLDASGGSWFAILALTLALIVISATVTALIAPGRSDRLLTPNGAAVCSFASLVMMSCYLASANTQTSFAGVGVYIAWIGALAASFAAFMWMRKAPQSSTSRFGRKVEWLQLAVPIAALCVALTGAFSAWSVDSRADQNRSDETDQASILYQQRLAELEKRIAENPGNIAVYAAELPSLNAEIALSRQTVISGVSNQNARIGLWALIAAIFGCVTALGASGLMGRDEHLRWLWSAATLGAGLGISATALGWILTHVRSADAHYTTGVGALLMMCAGIILQASASRLITTFHRDMVYPHKTDNAQTSISHAG